MRVKKGSKIGAVSAILVPLAIAALSLSASALTVSIATPAPGTWTAATTIDVSGTSGAPTADRRVLDTTPELNGGTEINVSTAGDRVSLVIPSTEDYRYTQDFTGLALSASIDSHWMWNLTGTFWQVTNDGTLSATPPSLGHSGTTAEHAYWNSLLPGPFLDGHVAFNYVCQANAQLDLWASGSGSPVNRTSILSVTGTAASAYYYNLTSVLAASPSVVLHFRIGASSATNSACAIDDFEFVATVDTSAAATAVTFFDNLTAGANTVWNGYPGGWALGSPPNVTDTPPALYHFGMPSTSMWANWASATPIINASLQFHYQCQANASLQAFLSTDGVAESRILNGARGANHTMFAFNATTALRGATATFLRFASDAVAMPGDSCGVDDVFLAWNVTGFLGTSYQGSYATPIIDLGALGSLTTADWIAALPPVSSLTLSIRSSANNATYSSWTTVPASGASVAASGVRFVQFRANFTSTGNRAIPYIDRIGLNFAALVRVEVSVNGGPWSAAAGITAWNATVALAGGSNNITARVTDSSGATTQSVAQVWRDIFPPSAPGKPVGSAVTNQTSATWSWPAATDFGLGIDHYLVDIGLTPAGTELGAGLVAASTTFTMSGLPDNVRVYATVWAVDLAGLTSLTASTSDATLVDRTPPGVPNIAAQAAFTGANAITWTWSTAAESGSGVDHYEVRLGSQAGGSEYDALTTTALNYTFSGGVSSSTYYLSVSAVDVAGNHGPFADASAVTVDQGPPGSPAPVTGPSAVTNSTALTWSWVASTDALSGVDHYLVTLGTSPGGSELGSFPWSGTTYTASSIAPGARYYFEVRAVDAAGNAGSAATAAAVLVDDEAPSAPSVDPVAAFVAAATFTVTWNASTDAPDTNASGVDHYIVRVSDGTTTTPTDVSALEAPVALTDGTHYTVTVAAVDLAGNEGPEVSISFTSDRTGPAAPQSLKLTISSADGPTFQASWNGTSDTGSGVKEYRISIGTTPGGTQVRNGGIVTGTSEKWTGSFGTTYYVTVWAVDNLGNPGTTVSSTAGITAQKPGSGGGGFLPGPEAGAVALALLAVAVVARVRRRP